MVEKMETDIYRRIRKLEDVIAMTLENGKRASPEYSEKLFKAHYLLARLYSRVRDERKHAHHLSEAKMYGNEACERITVGVVSRFVIEALIKPEVTQALKRKLEGIRGRIKGYC